MTKLCHNLSTPQRHFAGVFMGLGIAISLFTSSVPHAWAISACGDGDPFCLLTVAQDAGIKNESQAPSIAVSLGRIIQVLISLVGVVFFILMLYAGFRWMIAQGNQEDVDSAKKTIENAAVGLIAVLISYALTAYITKSLFEIGTPTLDLPPGINACSTSCKPSCGAGEAPGPGTCSSGGVCCVSLTPAPTCAYSCINAASCPFGMVETFDTCATSSEICCRPNSTLTCTSPSVGGFCSIALSISDPNYPCGSGFTELSQYSPSCGAIGVSVCCHALP